MEYLNRVLGVQVRYDDTKYEHLPNFINSRYRIQKVLLDRKEVLFVYPLTELAAVETLKKHIARIQKKENIPIVIVLERLTYRQKEYLLKNQIPFIVEGKQIYLPFMAVYLQEKCDAEKSERDEILPSAQMVLIYFIYQGSGCMVASQAVDALNLTSTSVSRAVRQLENFGLVQTRKEGIQKIICSERTAKELFEFAGDYLQNPVKRKIYIPTDAAGEYLLKSGYSALGHYSMLNAPEIKCFAAKSVARWNGISTNKIHSIEQQAEVELWRYDPQKLSDTDCVDPLSLSLALHDDGDERVEEAVEQMLDQLWGEIDGHRN